MRKWSSVHGPRPISARWLIDSVSMSWVDPTGNRRSTWRWRRWPCCAADRAAWRWCSGATSSTFRDVVAASPTASTGSGCRSCSPGGAGGPGCRLDPAPCVVLDPVGDHDARDRHEPRVRHDRIWVASTTGRATSITPPERPRAYQPPLAQLDVDAASGRQGSARRAGVGLLPQSPDRLTTRLQRRDDRDF